MVTGTWELLLLCKKETFLCRRSVLAQHSHVFSIFASFTISSGGFCWTPELACGRSGAVLAGAGVCSLAGCISVSVKKIKAVKVNNERHTKRSMNDQQLYRHISCHRT